MKYILIGILLMLVGCQGEKSDVVKQTYSPPSLQLVPVGYYRYKYSRKFHKRVREIIPANELEPFYDVDKDKKLTQAADDVYKAQKNLEIIPK